MTNGSCEQISDLRWDDPICCRVALWLNWASLAIYFYIWFTMEFGGETRGLMRWRIRYWGFRGNGNWNLALPHYDMLWSFGNTPPPFSLSLSLSLWIHQIFVFCILKQPHGLWVVRDFACALLSTTFMWLPALVCCSGSRYQGSVDLALYAW